MLLPGVGVRVGVVIVLLGQPLLLRAAVRLPVAGLLAERALVRGELPAAAPPVPLARELATSLALA